MYSITFNNEIIYFGFYALVAAFILKSEAVLGLRAIASLICKCNDWIIARQMEKARNSLPVIVGRYCFIRIICRIGGAQFRDNSEALQPPFLFADHQLYYS